MDGRRHYVLLAALAIGLTPATPGHAWWDGGHAQVVAVACSQMSSGRVFECAELLEWHPYYERDFMGVMPDSVRKGPALERATWLLAQAANWPDMVRSEEHPAHEGHHHGTWHYVNFPVFLDDSDAAAFEGQLPANVSMDLLNGAPADTMNVVQVLKWTLECVDDAKAPLEAKAIGLCWILHLVGDVHQPMHSTALFSEEKLPEGDLGGNRILVRGKRTTNLHRLWDSAAGTADDFDDVLAAVEGYLKDRELTRAGERSADQLDVEAWARESHAIARKKVYTLDLLGMIRTSDPNARGLYGPFTMEAAYFRTVEKTARVRIVEAGYRLGAVLEHLEFR